MLLLALSRGVPTAVRVAAYTPRTSRRRAPSATALTPHTNASSQTTNDALLSCARVGDAVGVKAGGVRVSGRRGYVSRRRGEGGGAKRRITIIGTTDKDCSIGGVFMGHFFNNFFTTSMSEIRSAYSCIRHKQRLVPCAGYLAWGSPFPPST